MLVLVRLLPGAVPTINTLARAAELDHLYPEASPPQHPPSSEGEGELSFSDNLENSEKVRSNYLDAITRLIFSAGI